jgi:hypothetical protein
MASGVTLNFSPSGLIEPAIASAFPVACCGVSERIKIDIVPYREDSPLQAAGSFNNV